LFCDFIFALRAFFSFSALSLFPLQDDLFPSKMPFVDRKEELTQCLQALVHNKVECGPGSDTKTKLVMFNQMFGSGKTTLARMLTRLPSNRREALVERIDSRRRGQDVARRILEAHYVLADLNQAQIAAEDLVAPPGASLSIKHYSNALLYEAVNRSLDRAWSWRTSATPLNGEIIL
jgi:hypothetical protein